jgi:hypothetical protein
LQQYGTQVQHRKEENHRPGCKYWQFPFIFNELPKG